MVSLLIRLGTGYVYIIISVPRQGTKYLAIWLPRERNMHNTTQHLLARSTQAPDPSISRPACFSTDALLEQAVGLVVGPVW